MLFNSPEFVLLAGFTFLLYYLRFFRNLQVHILTAASLVFYGWSSIELLSLLLICIFINGTLSWYVCHYPDHPRRKLWVTTGVVLNLGILFFFKYGPLAGKAILRLDDGIGAFLMSIPLPVGISFYTFHVLSMLIDVYRKNTDKTGSLLLPRNYWRSQLNQLFYIAFFPQLVAGPIVKAHEFLPQIRTKYFRDIPFEMAFRNIVLGYFLKMVLADNLGEFTSYLSYPALASQTGSQLLLLLLAYSCQIFADFAGYSLIAIGLCRLYGYTLPSNFNFPYISASFAEFWRRWHISLSTWLRDYLYVPLGGNRKGPVRTYINLMIVMLLGGFWHGAALSYMVWGAYHGGLLALERFLGTYIRLPRHAVIRFFQMLLVFGLVTLGWLLFKLPNFSEVIAFGKAVFSNGFYWADFRQVNTFYILLYSLPVLLWHVHYLVRDSGLYLRVRRFEYIVYGLLLFGILLLRGYPGEFIYFQF
ncbi:MAG: MBOAT family protein [Bacteroidetes bacterium]|nr:MBOAT family protein [Bacteroidota bacterium]